MDRKSSLNVDLLFQCESHRLGDFWFDRRVQGLIFKIQCTFFPWRSQRNYAILGCVLHGYRKEHLPYAENQAS